MLKTVEFKRPIAKASLGDLAAEAMSAHIVSALQFVLEDLPLR